MPHVTVNGARHYYEVRGSGPATIVFAHGCLLNCRMFDCLIDALSANYRCISFDFRGQGQSEVTSGGYELCSLTADTTALVRLLGASPCHFVGFSMGGFVGMRMAVKYPNLLRSLTLIGTSASPEPQAFRFRSLCWLAWLLGPHTVSRWVMPIQFGPEFLSDLQCAQSLKFWHQQIAANSRHGAIRTTNALIRRPDYSDRVGRIRLPTLIVAGDADCATPPSEAVKLHALIPGSELVIVAGAGHAVPIEKPAEVTDALAKFLMGTGSRRHQRNTAPTRNH